MFYLTAHPIEATTENISTQISPERVTEENSTIKILTERPDHKRPPSL